MSSPQTETDPTFPPCFIASANRTPHRVALALVVVSLCLGFGLWAWPVVGQGASVEALWRPLPLEEPGRWMAFCLGLLALLALPKGIKLALDKGCVLRIDQTGVMDRRLADTVIPWDHIDHIERMDRGQRVTIALHLIPSLRVRVRSSFFRRLLGLVSKRAGYSVIPVRLSGLDENARAIIDGFRAFTPYHLKHRGAQPSSDVAQTA